MKQLLTILFLFVIVCIQAQSKKEREALGNASQLEIAIFQNKDSLTLDRLFAKSVFFSWPNGKTESNREEAIKSLTDHGGRFTYTISPSSYNIKSVADSFIVKHNCKVREIKSHNTDPMLGYLIESVWAKEDGKLKLFRCEIVKFY